MGYCARGERQGVPVGGGWACSGPWGDLRGVEFVLVHLSEGRDGCVQIAQGKLQEHDGRGRMGASHVLSVCIWLEVCDLRVYLSTQQQQQH